MQSLPPILRLIHPLPTLLNAAVAAGLTLVAGGSDTRAALAALTMVGIHASIGALNDLLDERSDQGRTEKPLAMGELHPRTVRTIIAVSATIGFGAASLLGADCLQIAVAGATLGYLYDAGVKRTWLSFLPFALGVALIPLFAWSAAGAAIAPAILLLSLAAIPGGSALALQNGLADYQLDRAAGTHGIVVRIGQRTTLALATLLHAIAFAFVLFGTAASALSLALGATLAAGGLIVSAGGEAHRRRRGWELSACGLALYAAGVALSTSA